MGERTAYFCDGCEKEGLKREVVGIKARVEFILHQSWLADDEKYGDQPRTVPNWPVKAEWSETNNGLAYVAKAEVCSGECLSNWSDGVVALMQPAPQRGDGA